MFSPDINFSPLNNNENIAAGINWAGCGPSSPGQISSPDTNFFKMKMASPAIRLFEEYPGKVNLLFSAPLGCKSFLGGMH